MTFHALADRVLAEHAGKLVATGTLGTKQIADRLGYTSAAALVRAFRRWTGMTPTAWRDQQTKRRTG
jgi:AraC-like DNA-binding protein